MKGAGQNAFQGSETETKGLLGGKIETNIIEVLPNLGWRLIC